MKRFLADPIYHASDSGYIRILILIAPLINFLPGVNIDLYAPSLPSITNYFATSITLAKNTISAAMFGAATGSLLFGILIDTLGRKKSLLLGLFFYTIASLLAPLSPSIVWLSVIRFIQGVMISSISIGCRVLVVDQVPHAKYHVAILYTSIAYGLGPVLGPFIGGLIQQYVGWQANFYLLASLGFIFGCLILIFIKEVLSNEQSMKVHAALQGYIKVIKHKEFIAGTIIVGLLQTELLLYPTLGPFIIEDVLKKDVLVYGNTALLVGGSYLLGSLKNRMLLPKLRVCTLCYFGFIGLTLGFLLIFLFTLFLTLSIWTLVIPFLVIGASCGFIFANIMGINLKEFPHNAGVAMSSFVMLSMLISSLSIFIISHVHIESLAPITFIYFIVISVQIIIFFRIYRPLLLK